MKKMILIILVIIILFASFLFLHKNISPITSNTTNNDENINKNSVTYNSWLHTDGYRLKNSKNELIQLRGLSSHGIEWFGDLITYQNLENLKNDWNINVFRIAMYTDSNGQGYISNPEQNKEMVYKIVDMAVQLDMYVIVDWHILTDNNPQTHMYEAKLFFDEVSKKYANSPNVIYEICNEPNGSNVSWDNNIKPYAEEIISVIRNNSEKALIIVGTPDWSKGLNKAADNPLDYDNIVYSCHFYSGSHGEELRKKIDYCIEKNIPVFVSECGLTDASGNGNVYFEEFRTWIDYLNSNNISWVYWSFSNKNEASALLTPEYVAVREIDNLENNKNTNSEDNLSTNSDDSLNNNSNNSINNNDSDTLINNDLNINNSNTEKELQYINFNDFLTDSGKFIKSIFQAYSN